MNSRKPKAQRGLSGGIDQWRYPERMEVVYSSGTLHARAALPASGQAPGQSDFLRDTGEILAFDQFEREIAPDMRIARSATGGLTLRSGRLREVLAEAELDAIVKLRSAEKFNE